MSDKFKNMSESHVGGVNLKYLSLIVLTIQNATLILSIRYTRTLPGDMYLATTVVVFAEFFKMLACLAVILKNEGSVKGLFDHVHYYTVIQWKDAIKISVPAILYVIQNNLQYVAISNLEAAVFQVTYQLKIMTTAIFSVFLLRKELIRTQWMALVLLFVGVATVQLSQNSSNSKSESLIEQDPLLGLVAVLLSCCSSGFAGVYFEKLLKGSDISLWMRNIHLAGYGVIVGLVGVWCNDGAEVREKGFFHGYNLWVWWVVAMQAFGGLLVAVVVKYADNILKGFATSLAIIVSCVVSVFVWGFVITGQFALGTGLVLGAVYMYSLPKPVTQIIAA